VAVVILMVFLALLAQAQVLMAQHLQAVVVADRLVVVMAVMVVQVVAVVLLIVVQDKLAELHQQVMLVV